MSAPPVEFLLQAVLHLPQPADLDVGSKEFQRLGLIEAGARDRHVIRGLIGEYEWPEGTGTVYATITTLTDKIPPRWQPPPGVACLQLIVGCHQIPRPRAEPLARAIFDVMGATAEKLEAVGGFIDLGERQGQPDSPLPWASIRSPAPRRWSLPWRRESRMTVHRKAAFPDGLVEGKMGFPVKRDPIPSCLLVAGIALPDDSPEAIVKAKGAGLRVWHVTFVSKPPRIVAGLLVASLALAEHQAEVAPELAREFLRDAAERLERIGLRTPPGLLMARVRDPGGI